LIYVNTIQAPQEQQQEIETQTLAISTNPMDKNEQTEVNDPIDAEEINIQQKQTETTQKEEPHDFNENLTAVITENPPEEFDLTIAVNGFGSISPSVGIHTYTEATDVNVTATPSTGWTFKNWLINSGNVGSNIHYTVTMNSNKILTAVFTENPPDPSSAKLHTDGRWIKNDNDKIVFLRGINRPSLEWTIDGTNWSEETWDTMESWNANVVRVTFNREWWENGISQPRIQEAIDWGKERGMYTILAMIWWLREPSEFQLMGIPPDVPAWIDTWTDIAETYKDNPYVLFDLWGEPHDIPEGQWWTAAQECVDGIRSTRAQNLILVGVLNWSHDARVVERLQPIAGENIVYSFHSYPHEFGDSETISAVKNEITDLGWKYILDNNIAPVIIGEFGAFPDKIEEIDFMKALGRIANGQENNDGTDWRMSYLAWWFIPYPEEHALIYQDWVTPTASGRALIDAINGGPQ